jgi:hypothetical protein
VEQVGLRNNNYLSSPPSSLSFSIFNRILLNGLFSLLQLKEDIEYHFRQFKRIPSGTISEPDLTLFGTNCKPKNNNIVK